MLKLLLKVTVLFVYCKNKTKFTDFAGRKRKRGCGPKFVNKTKKRNLFTEAQDCFAHEFLSDTVLAGSFFVQNLSQIGRG